LGTVLRLHADPRTVQFGGKKKKIGKKRGFPKVPCPTMTLPEKGRGESSGRVRAPHTRRLTGWARVSRTFVFAGPALPAGNKLPCMKIPRITKVRGQKRGDLRGIRNRGRLVRLGGRTENQRQFASGWNHISITGKFESSQIFVTIPGTDHAFSTAGGEVDDKEFELHRSLVLRPV